MFVVASIFVLTSAEHHHYAYVCLRFSNFEIYLVFNAHTGKHFVEQGENEVAIRIDAFEYMRWSQCG